MCNQQELLKWGGSSWSSVQRQSWSWVGLHGACCSLACLCVTPRGAAALTGAENAQESWMCTQSHRTLGRLRLSSSPHQEFVIPALRVLSGPQAMRLGVRCEGTGMWVLR